MKVDDKRPPSETAPQAAPQVPMNPTHVALALDDLSVLIKYFRETPMRHDVSDPFLCVLKAAPFIALKTVSEAAALQEPTS